MIGNVSLELGDARLRFAERPLACGRVVLAGGARPGARLARLALRKPHFISAGRRLRRLGLRLDAPARLALAGGSLGARGYGGETAAILVELVALLPYEAICLFGVDAADAVGLRDIEDPAGTHEVDVAADEGVFVRAEDGDQHLIQAHA